MMITIEKDKSLTRGKNKIFFFMKKCTDTMRVENEISSCGCEVMRSACKPSTYATTYPLDSNPQQKPPLANHAESVHETLVSLPVPYQSCQQQ